MASEPSVYVFSMHCNIEIVEDSLSGISNDDDETETSENKPQIGIPSRHVHAFAMYSHAMHVYLSCHLLCVFNIFIFSSVLDGNRL